MALTLRLRANRQDDLSGEMHANVCALPHRRAPALTGGSDTDPGRRRRAADFHICGKPDAQISTLLACLLLFFTEGLVADQLKGLIQSLFIIATIILQPCQDI